MGLIQPMLPQTDSLMLEPFLWTDSPQTGLIQSIPVVARVWMAYVAHAHADTAVFASDGTDSIDSCICPDAFVVAVNVL